MVYKRKGTLKDIDGCIGTARLGKQCLYITVPLAGANEKDVDDCIEEEQ